MKKKSKIIVLLLMSMILLYIGYAIYLLISNPTDTYVIKQGTITQEESGVGYIIREEDVIEGKDYGNGIYAIANEGERVSKKESVFRYYNDEEKDITKKISEIDYKIQELLEQSQFMPSADIKSIEKQIDSKLENINKFNDFQEIYEHKNSIDLLIGKKIKFIQDVTENNEIKELIKQRNQYEEQIKNGSEYILTESSGIISYRVDGLEEKLTPESFNDITKEYLDNLGLKTGQIIATSNKSGKVINNFKCYIAVTLYSNEAINAKVGDKVSLRIANNIELSAVINQINEEIEGRTIIFELDQIIEELINHRKIEVNIIWWNESGLKVPNKAIIEENGLNYVIKNRAGTQNKILVKVENQNEKFSIISTYSIEELQEIGYNQDDIRKYKKIYNYDEIMVNPTK